MRAARSFILARGAVEGAYSGFHLNYDCNQNNQAAGGFKVSNSVLGKVIEGVTLDPLSEPTGAAQAFYLDIKHSNWYLYEIGGQFSQYTEIASGRMLKGAPPADKKGGVSSRHPKAGAKIEPMPAF